MLREEKDEKKLKEIMGKKKVERVGGWRESKLLQLSLILSLQQKSL